MNKNFDAKGRFKGAAIAVNTVNSMSKETYSTRSHCCKYVKPTKKRKVVFKESLLFDLAHSDSDLQHFSVYGGCNNGEHRDIPLKAEWNSLNIDCSSNAPERYKSSPEILSPTEKHRYFYDDVSHSNEDRLSEEARQFKEHLCIEESKQDEKCRSALELRQVEHERQGYRQVHKNPQNMVEKTGKEDDSFSRFGRTRKQVNRQKGVRRPRSCSVQEKKEKKKKEKSRKRSYDIPLQNREGKQVKKYSVPEIDKPQVSLENFIERDIVFSVGGLQDSCVTSAGNLSSFEQLEASIAAENSFTVNGPVNDSNKEVSEVAQEFEMLSLDGKTRDE